MPKVTIIVPVFNTEQYLSKCLESLVSQTFEDIEIICIDDGSTDGSGALLDQWAARDSRIVVVHQKNGGVSVSRNKGLELAHGEFVLFVDSDDYIEPLTCERLVSTAHSECADIVVFGGYTFPKVKWIDNCLDTRRVTYKGKQFEALFNEGGSYPLMCNKFYRRETIEASHTRFVTGLPLGEDHVFQFEVFPAARTVAYIPDALYHYRCDRESSAIATFYSDRLTKIQKHLDVLACVLANWNERGLVVGHRKELLAWASSFLYDDYVHLSYEDRVAFSKFAAELVDSYELRSEISELEHDSWQIAEYVLGSYAYDLDKPLVSVILDCSVGSDRSWDCIESLLNQGVQNLEVLAVDVEMLEDEARRHLESDPRFRKCATKTEALSEAKGSWVLLTSAHIQYDWSTLRSLISCGDRYQAQVSACPDRYGYLRLQRPKDTIRMVQTQLGTDLDKCGRGGRLDVVAFRPCELGDHVFQSVSLLEGNKLIRTDFLRSIAGEHLDAGVLARVILESDMICLIPDYGVTVHHAVSAGGAVVGRLTDLFESLDRFEERIPTIYAQNSLVIRSLDNARLESLASWYGVVFGDDARASVFHFAKERLDCWQALEERDSGYFFNGDDYAFMRLLAKSSFSELLVRDRDLRISGFEEDMGEDRSVLLDTMRELYDVYESTSLHVGLAVTYLPRKAVACVRRLLHR